MTLFLEDINMELNENNNNIEYKQINYSNKKSKNICNNEIKIFFCRRQSSIINDQFIYY